MKNVGILAILMITAVILIAVIKPAQAKDEMFSSDDEIYMYCLNNWEELGVLPSVAISCNVATPTDVKALSENLSECKNIQIFTDQLDALGKYDECYLEIRKSKLYNYDYEMFIHITKQKKTEAEQTIKDTETLKNILKQYDVEIQVYTACIN